MKRLVALLLALGVLTSVPLWADTPKDKGVKKEETKKEEKKEEKKDVKDKDTKKADKDTKKNDKDTKKADKGTKKEETKKEEKKEDTPKTEEKLSPEAKKELDNLSGTFNIVNFERDGKKSSPDDLKKMSVTQTGATWNFKYGDEITEGIDKVYPDKNPKAIDSTYTNGPAKGRTVQGIYEIKGDTVRYCWAEPGKERPKDFTSKAESGHTLMVLQKAKEAKPTEPKKEEKKEEKKDKK